MKKIYELRLDLVNKKDIRKLIKIYLGIAAFFKCIYS